MDNIPYFSLTLRTTSPVNTAHALGFLFLKAISLASVSITESHNFAPPWGFAKETFGFEVHAHLIETKLGLQTAMNYPEWATKEDKALDQTGMVPPSAIPGFIYIFKFVITKNEILPYLSQTDTISDFCDFWSDFKATTKLLKTGDYELRRELDQAIAKSCIEEDFKIRLFFKTRSPDGTGLSAIQVGTYNEPLMKIANPLRGVAPEETEELLELETLLTSASLQYQNKLSEHLKQILL